VEFSQVNSVDSPIPKFGSIQGPEVAAEKDRFPRENREKHTSGPEQAAEKPLILG
jgi:hypothetical protein